MAEFPSSSALSSSSEVTRLLIDWRAGNRAALEALTPVVYQELRKIAANHLRRERPGHTLQPTALIHEAYLRLVDQKVPEWQNRAHFFSVASQIMRQILVDFARSKSAAKRGGVLQVTLDDSLAVVGARAEEFLALHEGLERLKGFDERKARVIEMRYFGGMTREEVAEAMGLTLATVKRDLMLGEAWLRKELGAGELPPRD